MLYYRTLNSSDISMELFQFFIRRQVVTDCIRKKDNQWVIESDPFLDDWNENDYRILILDLQKLANSGGLILGGFDNNQLKAFASVSPHFFGKTSRYLDLTNLHVSSDMRRMGIGRTLFHQAAAWAKKQGADKLYISAHSAIETYFFYRAMGCVEAQTYNQEHVLLEPFDCQMEFSL